MKKLFLIIGYTFIWFLIFSNAYGQKASRIIKGYVFYKLSLPGLNKMDEYGNSLSKIDTTYFIYLVTTINAQPQIETVRFAHYTFSPSIIRLNEKLVIAGKEKNSNHYIRIEAGPGESIWRIDLQPTVGDVNPYVKEYKKFTLFFQKKLHSKPFQIQACIELQGEEHN